MARLKNVRYLKKEAEREAGRVRAPGAAVLGAPTAKLMREVTPDVKNMLEALRLANTRDDLVNIILTCMTVQPIRTSPEDVFFSDVRRTALERLLAHVN